MRISIAASLLFALPALGLAQDSDPDKLVSNGGVSLPGWQGRIDPQAAKAGRKITDAKFVGMGSGFHVTSGPAAIYWSPANSMSGNSTLTASFTQTKAATHPEGYGLLIAGRDLDTPDQNYGYFLVRQDGQFMISHRLNDSTVHRIVGWTPHAAIVKLDANGRATNTLSVLLGPEALSFRVNGTEVHSLPRELVDRPGHAGTTGVAGVRINHNLDVHVDGFAVTTGQ